MVVLALVVVLVAAVLARALHRQRICGWYRPTHEQACLALRHRRLEHRHVWTNDEHVVRFGPMVDAFL